MEIAKVSQFFIPLLVALFVGAAAGSLGAFMVMKRMALVGDALTHVALPGMGLALIFGYDAFFGALVFLLAAIVGVWWLREQTKLSFEVLVGIFFTGALALGVLIVPNHELVESLFGDITSLGMLDAALAAFLAIVIWFGLRKLRGALIITTISE